MNVVLTGATGFLGMEVHKCLSASGHHVVTVSRRDLCHDRYVVLDLARGTLESFRKKLLPADAIIHLAADVDFCRGFSSQLYEVNTISSILLALVAEETNAQFVFTSTAGVAGAAKSTISISSEVYPDTPYALSKWVAERAIHSIARDSTILRFGGIFGLNGPAHLGLNATIAKALEKELPTLRGSGSGKRNYIYVKDAARAVLWSLERRITGTHLVAGTEVLSIRQMISAICAQFVPGQQPQLEEGSDTDDQIIVPSRAFPSTRSFAEALTDIERDYAKNRSDQ